MKHLWAPIDWLVEWVQHRVDTQAQQRVAMLTVLISIPTGLSGPLLPPGILQQLIYFMSAVALTLTGITWLASLQAARSVEESAAPPPPVP